MFCTLGLSPYGTPWCGRSARPPHSGVSCSALPPALPTTFVDCPAEGSLWTAVMSHRPWLADRAPRPSSRMAEYRPQTQCSSVPAGRHADQIRTLALIATMPYAAGLAPPPVRGSRYSPTTCGRSIPRTDYLEPGCGSALPPLGDPGPDLAGTQGRGPPLGDSGPDLAGQPVGA